MDFVHDPGCVCGKEREVKDGKGGREGHTGVGFLSCIWVLTSGEQNQREQVSKME